MGWSIPTYAGTYMGGLPSAARTAMFELCRGVNQREAAVNTSLTQFFKAIGTQSTNLTMADLVNIRATGDNSFAFQNLQRIRNAIIDLIDLGIFTETQDALDYWTKASMETAIGTDLDADPIRPQEARYWQAMQDALDRLIYYTIVIAPTQSTGTVYTGTTEADLQTAWDNRRSGSSASLPNANPSWSMGAIFSGVRAGVVEPGTYTFDATAYDGVVTSGLYNIAKTNGCEIDIDYSLTPFNGGAYTETLTAETIDFAFELSWISIEFDFSATFNLDAAIDTAEPATVPWTILDFPPTTDAVSIQVSSARIFAELTSILDDQL